MLRQRILTENGFNSMSETYIDLCCLFVSEVTAFTVAGQKSSKLNMKCLYLLFIFHLPLGVRVPPLSPVVCRLRINTVSGSFLTAFLPSWLRRCLLKQRTKHAALAKRNCNHYKLHLLIFTMANIGHSVFFKWLGFVLTITLPSFLVLSALSYFRICEINHLFGQPN